MERADVIVVGAGPAGAACAGVLKAGGVEVLLLDRHVFPRPKPCAGWVTPRVFDLLGVAPTEYPRLLASFDRLHLKIGAFPLLRRGRQYAIRRTEFDAWLLDRWGLSPRTHEARSLSYGNGRYVVDGRFMAPVIVGAGGTGCPVYRQLGRSLYTREHATEIIAMEEEFPAEVIDHRCRLWFFQDGLPGYAWHLPKVTAAESWINVGIGGARATLASRGKRLREHWQQLVRRLEARGLVEVREWRPVARNYHLRQPGELRLSAGVSPSAAERTPAGASTPAPSLYLVGDAAGLATVDMGEGIAAAIESGLLAGAAIIDGRAYSAASIPRFSLVPRLLQGLWRQQR